ncbi:MAG: CPBP family intramembrane metalloprotease [Chloroflexi bacterium]|nr:MAG: CPBP family intramembrane metalloprotease [Chloroflexota bacterium]TME41702.1 MAG: CPBP family intramembrane metalloprotease [Chloroflexota bacterium]TME52888.1 MAG: CPBP family intramembrane metalloprotease [Chloroflexota bacterium]
MSSEMQAIEVASTSQTQSGFVKLLRRYPLISYFVMAYAISWFYVIVFEIVWPLPDTIVTDVPLLFGPVGAGFVMTAVVAGRAGVKQLLRRLVLWRVSPRWYLLAVVGMPALYLLGLALVPGAFSSISLPLTTLLLLPAFFVVILVTGGPLLEEPGWRGFALPRLQQRWGPLVGTLILGVLWAGWHGPQYFTPVFSATNGGLTVSGVAIFLVAAVSFSLIITWAFNHTKASLVIAILIHQCINFSQGLTTTILPGAKNNEVGPVFAFAAAAVIIVIATRGRLGYSPQGENKR